ncbi:MAG TPA: hypothetical protein VHU19_16560 [Pyrinomonadaceae bacterium]|jgi:hypothetical protein|nr:hypothetical protein [Pyrinomonadaceae bacterium]
MLVAELKAFVTWNATSEYEGVGGTRTSERKRPTSKKPGNG